MEVLRVLGLLAVLFDATFLITARGTLICNVKIVADQGVFNSCGRRWQEVLHISNHLVNSANRVFSATFSEGSGEDDSGPTVPRVFFDLQALEIATDAFCFSQENNHPLCPQSLEEGEEGREEEPMEQTNATPAVDYGEGFCLVYLLTSRDMPGITGLAEIGGACESGSNVGLVRLQRQQAEVTTQTFIHELGHSFGAEDDPLPRLEKSEGWRLGERLLDFLAGRRESSDPEPPLNDDDDCKGDFIMQPYISGRGREFSTCSTRSISEFLMALESSANSCLKNETAEAMVVGDLSGRPIIRLNWWGRRVMPSL